MWLWRGFPGGYTVIQDVPAATNRRDNRGYRHPDPRQVEASVIARWEPPLNLDHAQGDVREVIKAARAAYYASA